MAGQVAPSELFPDVVNAGFRVDFHFVGGLGALHVTGDLLPGGHDEGVIAARTDPRGVVATCDRGAEQRRAIVVGPVDVNHRVSGRRGGPLEGVTLHRASGDEDRRDGKQKRHEAANHLLIEAAGGGAEPAAASAKRFASRYSFWSIRSRTATRAARSSSA